MKKKIIGYASTAVLTAALAVAAAAPSQAANGRNAAAAIGFGAGAAVGAAAAGAASTNYYAGPAYHETYAYQPADECRIIIRHHLNRFGERVTVRERVCD
jgi:hypothetical protein